MKQNLEPANNQAEEEVTPAVEVQEGNAAEETISPVVQAHQQARDILEASKSDFQRALGRAVVAHRAARAILEASKSDFQRVLSETDNAHRSAREKAEKAQVAVAEERASDEAEAKLDSEAGQVAVAEAGTVAGPESSAELYQGKLELEITALNAKQVSDLLSELRKVPGLQVMSLKRSANGESTISLVIKKPIPLTGILEEMPAVELAYKNGENIAVALKGRGRRLWEY